MKLSDFTNLSGQFVEPCDEGPLLSSLGIFTSRLCDTQIIALDTLVEYAMVQSLLHNTVEATHLCEGPTIHWDQFWGY